MHCGDENDRGYRIVEVGPTNYIHPKAPSPRAGIRPLPKPDGPTSVREDNKVSIKIIRQRRLKYG